MILAIPSPKISLENIKHYIVKTPLTYSERLSNEINSNIFLKLENLQKTGSFKARGALNKILNINNSKDVKTIIISGDRHIGGIYSKKFHDLQLLEITSSSLNKPLHFLVSENDSYQVGDIVTQANFGLIKIDWNSGDVILELRSTRPSSTSSVMKAVLDYKFKL